MRAINVSAVAPSTPSPPPAAAAPLCLLTQFTVATYPFPLPSSPTGCLWLCIFDLLSSFSYFLLFWHSQRLRWTHKGGQQQEVEGQVAWAGMRGMHGAGGEGGRPAGQLHLPTLCACTLHMAQRRRRPVAVCVDTFSASISHFCVIFIPST